jgi:hypothetical protein
MKQDTDTLIQILFLDFCVSLVGKAEGTSQYEDLDVGGRIID